jgi:hypothetical protein
MGTFFQIRFVPDIYRHNTIHFRDFMKFFTLTHIVADYIGTNYCLIRTDFNAGPDQVFLVNADTDQVFLVNADADSDPCV